MMKYLYILIVLMGMLPSIALADEGTLADDVKSYNNMRQSLEMKTGRTDTLQGTHIIETTDLPDLAGTKVIYDFDNGLLIRENDVSADPEKEGCSTSIIPFSQLPAERVDEVKAIGCLIYERENRLATHDDSLAVFHRRYCR